MNKAHSLIRRVSSLLNNKVLTEAETVQIPDSIKELFDDKSIRTILSRLIIEGFIDYVYDNKEFTIEEAYDIVNKALTEDPNLISIVPMKYRLGILKDMPELFFVRRNRDMMLYDKLIEKFPIDNRLEIAKNNIKEIKYIIETYGDEIFDKFTKTDADKLRKLIK